MSDPREQDPKIKVVDRRRFTDDGELRPDREPAASGGRREPGGDVPPPVEASRPAAPSKPVEAPRPVESPRPAETPRGSEEERPTAPLFLELVNDLAQQAALLIEGAEGFPAQPAQARRIIDYLSVLEEKTKGTLSREEEQALAGVVFQLRTLYVKRTS